MTAPETDVPVGLIFVDPHETPPAFRVVLWAAPGAGKTVGAASAPDPILAVSADRPRAWQFARRQYPNKDIRETRFTGPQTLADVYRYLQQHHDEMRGGTVVLDPWQTIYNKLVDTTPLKGGEVDYQAVNKKAVGFLHSLRQFDVNVVIVAHERLSEGKHGDGKLYPQLGGPSLINEILKESDVVGRVEREPGGTADDGSVIPDRYMAQLMPRDNLVVKETLGLGDRREINLTEWFEEARASERRPVEDAAPWDDDYEPPEDAPAAPITPVEAAPDPAPTLDVNGAATAPDDVPAAGAYDDQDDGEAEPDDGDATDIPASLVAGEIKRQGIKADELRALLRSVNVDPPAQLASEQQRIDFLETVPGQARNTLAAVLVLRNKAVKGETQITPRWYTERVAEIDAEREQQQVSA